MIELYSTHSSDGSNAVVPSTQLAATQQMKREVEEEGEGECIVSLVYVYAPVLCLLF